VIAHLAPAPAVRIGGFEKLSTVDWPGQLAAVVFCQGCAWRCVYCHNPHLIPFATNEEAISWRAITRWLETRRGLLDGVVFSGGEPTLQPGLAAAMEEARALGFAIGLHTGGPVPEHLARVLPFTDWVGFDFKAPFDRYVRVTGHDQGSRARESLRLLHAERVAYEVRTTWHPRLLAPADLAEMAQTLPRMGVVEWVIQRFRANGCDDPELMAEPVGEVPREAFCARGLRVTVR